MAAFDPIQAVTALLADFDSPRWTFDKPERIAPIWEYSHNDRINFTDTALYLYTPTDSAVKKFSIDDDSVNQPITIEVLIMTLDESETQAYLNDVSRFIQQLYDDNTQLTPFHRFSNINTADLRNEHITQQTDHYLASVTFEVQRFSDIQTPTASVAASGIGQGFGGASITLDIPGISIASGFGSGVGDATPSSVKRSIASGVGIGSGVTTGTQLRENTASGTGQGTGSAAIAASKGKSATGSGIGNGISTPTTQAQVSATGVGQGIGTAVSRRAPSSVAHQYTGDNFTTSTWPDNIGNADMSINGVSASTLNGDRAASSDGVDDFGETPTGTVETLASKKNFAVAFVFSGLSFTFAKSFFGLSNSFEPAFNIRSGGFGTAGSVEFTVADNGNNLLAKSTQNTFDNGTAHLVVINKSGNNVSDISIYIDDMKNKALDTAHRNENFDNTNITFSREMTFFARDNSGSTTDFIDINYPFIEFNEETYSQQDRLNLKQRAPGL
jgi:hypothetical protein